MTYHGMSRRKPVFGHISLFELDNRRRGRSRHAHQVLGRLSHIHENSPKKADFSRDRTIHIPKPERKKQAVEDLVAHRRAQTKQIVPELAVNGRVGHNVSMVSVELFGGWITSISPMPALARLFVTSDSWPFQYCFVRPMLCRRFGSAGSIVISRSAGWWWGKGGVKVGFDTKHFLKVGHQMWTVQVVEQLGHFLFCFDVYFKKLRRKKSAFFSFKTKTKKFIY